MPAASVEAAPTDVATGAATAAAAASPPLAGGGYTFKKQNFISKYGKKKKNLKMIAMGLKQQKWPPSAATYTSITAPLSTRLQKKYSDISGLEGRYTDPRTQIRYGVRPLRALSLPPSLARSLLTSLVLCLRHSFDALPVALCCPLYRLTDRCGSAIPIDQERKRPRLSGLHALT